MKRTFLAMLMVGSSMAMFAQTTPTTPTTTPTNPSTPPATNQSTTTNSTTNSTTDPMNTTTNTQTNSNTNNGNWNNTTNSTTNMSTSWEPGTSPYWGWNSYGIFNNAGTTNMNSTTSMNGTSNMNSANMNNTGMNTNMSSTGSYNAYGTAVTALPPNVNYRFSQDFPSAMNNSYSWNQYGDWFHTQYRANGRSMHYFYNQRGDGYALALPVIQTYVPEDIIDKALNKYGSTLYSIGMVKAVDTGNVYQLGIIERGQLRMEYLNDAGATVANVWRTEDMNTAGTLTTSDANAAMGTDMSTSTDTNMSNTDKETKVKWKENGVKTKIKSEGNKVKIKQKKVDD